MTGVLMPLESAEDLAELLARHRAETGATQKRLAERSGLTRLTVSKAERGSTPNIPLAGAAKLAAAAGMDLVAVPSVARPPAVRFDLDRVLDALAGFAPSKDAAVYEAAEQNQPAALDGALKNEGRPLPWVKVRVLTQDVSTKADPLTVWRARELLRLYRLGVAAAQGSSEPPLTAVTPLGSLHAGSFPADPLARALTWVCQAMRLGAPENQSWFTAGANLVWHGRPWLNRYGDSQAHDDALAKLKVTGDADDYLAVYLADLPIREWRWTVD
ncbi:MAG: helix-turn-helix domain-containing protein [Bifidobacteriaceae bacterium]|nr:helix-turn-helix domain-containing protein [Bifidobacteriaceae bacterium]